MVTLAGYMPISDAANSATHYYKCIRTAYADVETLPTIAPFYALWCVLNILVNRHGIDLIHGKTFEDIFKQQFYFASRGTVKSYQTAKSSFSNYCATSSSKIAVIDLINSIPSGYFNDEIEGIVERAKGSISGSIDQIRIKAADEKARYDRVTGALGPREVFISLISLISSSKRRLTHILSSV